MDIKESTEDHESTSTSAPNANLDEDWSQWNGKPDIEPDYVTQIKQEILNEENADGFQNSENIKEEWSETAVTDDSYGGEIPESLMNFSGDYMKTVEEEEEDYSEMIQNEDSVGYSSFICFNGIEIRVENKNDKIGNRTRPFNAAERSKRYRDKIKEDPDKRVEYLQKAKEKNLKSKISETAVTDDSYGGEIPESLMNFSGDYMKTVEEEEEDYRTRPFNAAERSKRYRDKIKEDPDKRVEYLQKAKEKNLKSKISETAVTDDSYGGEIPESLMNFSGDYMKTVEEEEEDYSEMIQNEDSVGYSSFICFNGIEIRVENKNDKIGNRTRPFNAAERSKRYRDKIKEDPDKRVEYLQKAKEKNLKSKIRKLVLSGKQTDLTEIKVEEPAPKTPVIREKIPKVPNLYKCNQCDFQTKYKHYIKVHVLRHKNPEENEIVKCAHCDYQTIHKTSFRKHILRHRDPEEVEKYHCTQCSYRTSDKAHLKRHSLVHMDTEEVVIYKCEDCDFQTVHKDSLKKHGVRHKDPSEVNLFKCTECDFQTPRKDSIKLHILRHQNPEDVDMQKCDVCDFQTVHKFSLKSHLLLHKDDKDKEWFRCTICDYRTIYKSSLKKHSVCHKRRDQVKMIKCQHCDYETADRGHLKRHSVLHKVREEVALKCPDCKFETLYKDSLKNHMGRHKKPKKEVIFSQFKM